MTTQETKKKPILDFALDILDDIKAQDVIVLDVSKQTTMTDYMVIATGTSAQHLRSIAGRLHKETKDEGYEITGIEGEQTSDWVLVDLGDVIVHLMLESVREFYALEKLWSIDNPDQHAD